MNTGMKITAFAAAIAATFGTANGVGQGIGPVAEPAAAAHGEHAASAEPDEDAAHAEHGEGAANAPAAGGLQVSEGGYTLVLETPRPAVGRSVLRFAVEDGGGRKVTAYATEHGKELHFIVASRDLTVYRHLHPVRAADGTWSTPVDLPAAGGYKVFADFRPDLSVPGAYAPRPLPAAERTAVVDGYRVTLGGTLDPGKPGELRLTVAKGGRPVTDLEPYLGAYGHLVALRAGDLAYLHVHPNAGGPGPVVSFTATAPSAGTYRLFLDFRHAGKVRTAAFTVRAGAGADADAPAAPVPSGSAAHDAGGHAHG
jgi:hypothetical protein